LENCDPNIEQHRYTSHNDRPDIHKRGESTHNIKKVAENLNYKNNNFFVNKALITA